MMILGDIGPDGHLPKETTMTASTQTKQNRALLVIDVQNEYRPDGGLPIAFPPFAGTLARIGQAMDAARANGVKVIVVKHMSAATSPVFARGSRGSDLHPDIAARPYDHLIEKTRASSFTGTDLEAWLKANDIDTLAICGYMTHNCDLATIIHASHMGYAVELLGDASGSLPYANAAGSASAEEIHRVITVVMHTGFAAVLDTPTWRTCLENGTRPACDNIVSSNQRARQAA
jgi:nicotinamidase-related amidase